MSILDLTNEFGLQFINEFYEAGFDVANSVEVSSRVDKSVYLVGSTISVLKPYLFEDDVPYKVLLQKAIRTQLLKTMENGTHSDSCYGSYFIAMGTLAPFSALDMTTELAIRYIRNIMPGDFSLKLRVNTTDEDLSETCRKTLLSYNDIVIEEDSRPIDYYRHHYGLDKEGITGRNFNIAVNNGNSNWPDIANVIVIENRGIPIAVEFAMGMSALIASLYGLAHTMEGNVIADILSMNGMMDYWLGDCISVVSCLQREDVRPNSSYMPGRLLKRYTTVLDRLCEQFNINRNSIIDTYEEYERDLLISL